MKSKKYIAQIIIFNIFRFSLYVLVTVIALYIVFARPIGVKQSFIETKAYERFVAETITAAEKANQNTSSAPISDPNIQQIIKESFPPQKLQRETENVIDAAYAWLYGNAKEPAFSVDFSQNIEHMATRLSEYGINRLKSQPICEAYQPTIDPFSATCRPAQFDYVTEKETLKNEIIKNNGIISKKVLTAADLPKTTDGKTLIQQYSYAPKLFSFMLFAPLIALSVTFASALIVVYLDRKKRAAVRSIGSNIISANLFLILSPIVYFYVLPFFFPSLGNSSMSGGGGAVLGDVINKVSIDFSNWLIKVGVAALFIGISIILLERSTRPKSKYLHVDKSSGITTSETARKNKKGKVVLSEASVPLQTSEGRRSKHKYPKNKKYRKIPKKEF